MKTFAIAALRGYQRWISPSLPTACRFVPTCSDYAMEAIAQNGLIRGSLQAIWRFMRCNPLGGSGLDAVPCSCSKKIEFDSAGDLNGSPTR